MRDRQRGRAAADSGEPPAYFLLPPPPVPDDFGDVGDITAGGKGIIGPWVMIEDCVDSFVAPEVEVPAALPLVDGSGASAGGACVPPHAGVEYGQGGTQGGMQTGINKCCDTP